MGNTPSRSDLSLAGKIAVVTGGGTGIGKAIALEFARAGADVAIAGRRQSVLDDTVAELRDLGRRAIAVTTDVQLKTDVDELASRVVEELGGVDILVNNPANGGSGPSLLDSDESRWDEIIDTNLKSVYLASHAFGPGMLERERGSIINISSIASLRPDGCRIYGIAKVGVNFLTRGLAQDMAPNVRVNCIAPGTVRTDMLTVDIGEEEENWDRLARYVPLKRVADPVDMGTVALFLASDASNYVTGQTLAVDGGLFL
jgi:NAD(P)-dependent dehydrogenase (short-subunit alcohol dehydrogenase family)